MTTGQEDLIVSNNRCDKFYFPSKELIGIAKIDREWSITKKKKMYVGYEVLHFGKENDLTFHVPADKPGQIVIHSSVADPAVSNLKFDQPIARLIMGTHHLIVVLQSHIRIISYEGYIWQNRDVVKHILACPADLQPEMVSFAMTAKHGPVLAYPSENKKGVVNIYSINDRAIIDEIRATVKKPLQIVVLNRDGTVMATASKSGHVVKVWELNKREFLHRFDRTIPATTITSICFSADSKLLAFTSRRKTIHVFKIDRENPGRIALPDSTEATVRTEPKKQTTFYPFYLPSLTWTSGMGVAHGFVTGPNGAVALVISDKTTGQVGLFKVPDETPRGGTATVEPDHKFSFRVEPLAQT